MYVPTCQLDWWGILCVYRITLCGRCLKSKTTFATARKESNTNSRYAEQHFRIHHLASGQVEIFRVYRTWLCARCLKSKTTSLTSLKKQLSIPVTQNNSFEFPTRRSDRWGVFYFHLLCDLAQCARCLKSKTTFATAHKESNINPRYAEQLFRIPH